MQQMNTATADLNLLKVFLAIWDTGSLTLAADRLALSQPAVSHCLRRLREQFHDPLFVRTADGMKPTAAAIRLHGPFDRALGMINEAMQHYAGFDAASATRRFRISMSDMAEYFFLPPLLSSLRDTAPGIGLEIVQVPLLSVEAGMRSGEIDLAIGYVPGLSAECASHTLFNDEHVCMVRAGHPLAGHTPLPQLLKELKYVFASSNATGHGLIDQWFGEFDIRHNIALHSPHFIVVPEVVRGTDLAVIFPRSIAERFNQSGGYQLLPLPSVLPPIEVKLHWHQRFASDAGLIWLRDTLLCMFGRHPHDGSGR
jgi:DNA-binding transcriptional LysR family regulator